jgi:hypothetical protein
MRAKITALLADGVPRTLAEIERALGLPVAAVVRTWRKYHDADAPRVVRWHRTTGWYSTPGEDCTDCGAPRPRISREEALKAEAARVARARARKLGYAQDTAQAREAAEIMARAKADRLALQAQYKAKREALLTQEREAREARAAALRATADADKAARCERRRAAARAKYAEVQAARKQAIELLAQAGEFVPVTVPDHVARSHMQAAQARMERKAESVRAREVAARERQALAQRTRDAARVVWLTARIAAGRVLTATQADEYYALTGEEYTPPQAETPVLLPPPAGVRSVQVRADGRDYAGMDPRTAHYPDTTTVMATDPWVLMISSL